MKLRIIHKKLQDNRGFTLIETFIAITILLLAITGPLFLVTRGLSISKLAKGQITSMYLAQEAVEYIRNTRDKNILNGVNWLDGLTNCVGKKCKIDSPSQDVESCDSGGCENLKYNTVSSLYTYASGEVSRFKRVVEIKEIFPNRELEVVVNMYWTDGPHERDFTVKESLLNWQ